jgi:hypothetical protein
MRTLLALAVLCAGCGDGPAPQAYDLSVQLGDEDLAPADGALTDGMPADLAGSDAACATACNCAPGNACIAGVCTPTVPQTFCCGTAECTGQNLCESATGQVSQCSLPPDAGTPRDGGSAGSCTTQRCAPGAGGDILCKIACANSTASCVTGGSGSACVP